MYVTDREVQAPIASRVVAEPERKRRVGRLVAGAALIVASTMGFLAADQTLAGAANQAPAATASVAKAGGCRAGLWSSKDAWGDCRGIGKQKWQLKVSCTWGQSKTSTVLTGDGHADVRCPIGTGARAASIIYR